MSTLGKKGRDDIDDFEWFYAINPGLVRRELSNRTRGERGRWQLMVAVGISERWVTVYDGNMGKIFKCHTAVFHNWMNWDSCLIFLQIYAWRPSKGKKIRTNHIQVNTWFLVICLILVQKLDVEIHLNFSTSLVILPVLWKYVNLVNFLLKTCFRNRVNWGVLRL